MVPPLLTAFAPPSRAAAPQSAAQAAAGTAAVATVRLEDVMAMVERVAGVTIDPDAPLMEAGLDSLAAVELRNELQRASPAGTLLPSTLVFDFPTARSLADFLAPQQQEPLVPAVRLEEVMAMVEPESWP